jgi:phosphohistidine phosphatase SixA
MPKKAAPPKDTAVDAMITLDDAGLAKIKKVAKSLSREGLDVSHIMESSGIIAGKATRADLDRLRAVEGVAAVELSGDVDIGPPGADPS